MHGFTNETCVPLQLQNYSNHHIESITKEDQLDHSKFLQGFVKIDGYSVAVHQPGARRPPPDLEGDIPDDCLAPGTDACKIGDPSLVLNEKDMVDHGERAGKIIRALTASAKGKATISWESLW
jgi:hypothetical protein